MWDEPIENWRMAAALVKRTPTFQTALRDSGAEARATLAEALARALASLEAPEGKRREGSIPYELSRLGAFFATDSEIEQAQAIVRRLIGLGGPGVSYTLNDYFGLIGGARQAVSIPFWREMLDINRPRDTLARQRRLFAVAALAWLALSDDPDTAVAGRAALLAAAEQPAPQVRALAATFIGRVALGDVGDDDLFDEDDEDDEPPAVPGDKAGEQPSSFPGGGTVIPLGGGLFQIERGAWSGAFEAEPADEPREPVPVEPDLLAVLNRLAVDDPEFTPRYAARIVLLGFGQPVPNDRPGGAYRLKVNLQGLARVHRTIAMRSEQTLADLHRAIQRAFEWDDDHLYAFYMAGTRWRPELEIAATMDATGPTSWEFEVGQLGLSPRHKFHYLFDFGDSHFFDISVVGIDARAAGNADDYPRVIASVGKAPEQYPDIDEDWDGEDEGDEDPDDA